MLAADALERLRDGNERFVAGARSGEALLDQAHRRDLAEAQQPFAVVIGCSDSRVPIEFVFDQGLGDLFVVRVAGNIVTASQVGSVEFAVDQFGSELVVVLGHTGCGAVRATIDDLRRPAGGHSPNLRAIVDRVRPAVEPLLASQRDDEELLDEATRANVRTAVAHLRHGSELLERRLQAGELAIVGAEYSLRTGVVDFFDEVP